MSTATEVGRLPGASAAESIYREYGGQVLTFVRGQFGRRHADDIASRVWEKLAMGRLPDPDRPVMPWLRTVALRTGIDHLRAEPRHAPLDTDLDAAGMDDGVARLHDRIVLEETLVDLTEVERDSIALFAEGWSPAEIGALHGRSRHAIHCLKSRTCGRLRLLLEQAMLPVFALLGLIRRTLRHVQPTPTATMAVEAVIMAALVLVVPGAGGDASRLAPADAIEIAGLGSRLAARSQGNALGALQATGPLVGHPPEVSPADSSARPHQPGVEIERDDGAAAPRHLGIYQPTVATPYGQAGGGSIENECTGEGGFEVVPRNDHLYRLC